MREISTAPQAYEFPFGVHVKQNGISNRDIYRGRILFLEKLLEFCPKSAKIPKRQAT